MDGSLLPISLNGNIQAISLPLEFPLLEIFLLIGLNLNPQVKMEAKKNHEILAFINVINVAIFVI